MFKFSFKLTVAVVISLMCVFIAASAAFAVDHIARAKEMLFNQNDIVGANAEFGQALNNGEYDQQVANFWCAVTEISQNDALRAKLRELKIFGSDDKPAVFDAEGELNYNPRTDVDNIIVDDTAAVYDNPATWDVVEDPDPESCYNGSARSHAGGTGSNTAAWTPTVITGGFYKVYAWVTTSSLNTSRAKYTIIYPGGSATTTIDQKWGGWEPLGSYYFPAGAITSIILSDETGQGRVIADAIKLEYHGMVIDDSTAGFQASGGGWQSVSGANGPVNGTYRWHEADASESATATWTFSVPDTSKEYLVYVTIPQMTAGAAANFKYTLTTANGPVNITVGYEQNSLHVCCLGLFRFSSATGNTLTLKSSAYGKVSADSVRIAPARPYPDMTEAQVLSSGPSGAAGMLTQIDAALAHLSHIDNNAKNFTDTVIVDNQTYLLDYGEAKMMESVLYSLKAIIKIDAAYEMAGVDIQPIILNQNSLLGTPLAFLDSVPTLFTLRPSAGAYLGDARTAVLSAIDSYYPASDFILDRDDLDGKNHLLDFHYPYPDRAQYGSDEEWNRALSEWQKERDAALEVEGDARNKTDEFKKNLTDHAAQPFVTVPGLPAGVSEKDMDFDINVDIDLSAFFSAPKNAHSYLDTFLPLPVIYDDTPGIDLGGILPNIKAEDWNYLLNIGPRFKSDPIVMWDGDVASVELDWDTANDTNAASIIKYEIYRASNLDMSDAVLVDTITDKAATTYTDTSLDASRDLHYYRIHTYYDFGGGHTARTYTQAGRALLRVYVDANTLSSPERGTKTAPYKSLGYATSEGAADGTKLCVAAGRYYEDASTLKLWRRSSLVMEGGYRASDWTRDIVANETVIDASGSNAWACIDVYNHKNFAIDGFTVTGMAGQGISAYYSNLTVRNCKIVNCNGGIRLQDCFSALVENCDLRGRWPVSNGWDTIGVWIGHNTRFVPACTTTIRYCSIADYEGEGINIGGGYEDTPATVTIFGNLILNNQRGGVSSGVITSVTIANNTIINNKDFGIYYNYSSIDMKISDNIIINNNGGRGRGINGDGFSGPKRAITNNNSYGNTGGNYYYCGTTSGQNGNISADPLFVPGTYYLSQTASGQAVTSPCVNAGSDTAANLGLANATTRSDGAVDAGIVDMGYHYPVAGAGHTISITGRVTDKYSAQPVANVRVSFSGDGTYKDTLTNGNGEYEVRGLPKGEYRVTAQPDSAYAWIGKTWTFSQDSGVNFRLSPESTLSGTVKDAGTDQPVLQAINVHYENYEKEVYRTFQTDPATGLFAMTGLPGGISELMFEPDVSTGYAWRHKYVYLSEGEDRTAFEAALERGALITGSVITPEGIKVPNAWLELKGLEGERWWGKADLNGDFSVRLTGSATKKYCVSLQMGNNSLGLTAVPQEFTVTGPTDNKAVGITVYGPSSYAHITGSVANPAGYTKTSGFSVAAFEAGKLINKNAMKYINPVNFRVADASTGAYDLMVPPGSNYDLYMTVTHRTAAYVQSYTVRQKLSNVPVGSMNKIFSYDSVGGTVTGAVIYRGNPVLMAKVFLVDPSGNIAGFADTDQNGVYHLYNVPAGDYRISGWHPDCGESAPIPVNGVADNTSVTADISLEQTEYITYYPSGRIKSKTLAEPDADGIVYYEYYDEPESRIYKTISAVADADGAIAYIYTYYDMLPAAEERVVSSNETWPAGVYCFKSLTIQPGTLLNITGHAALYAKDGISLYGALNIKDRCDLLSIIKNVIGVTIGGPEPVSFADATMYTTNILSLGSGLGLPAGPTRSVYQKECYGDSLFQNKLFTYTYYNTGEVASKTPVLAAAQANRAPAAALTITGVNDRNIRVSAAASDPDKGDIPTCSWDFGDGKQFTNYIPTLSYTYAPSIKGGWYSITLRVTDQHGAVSKTRKKVLINTRPAAAIKSITRPLRKVRIYRFTAAGADPDGKITRYEWRSSKNGLLSNRPSFTKLLAKGRQTITLRVRDNLGAWSTPVSKTIDVK